MLTGIIPRYQFIFWKTIQKKASNSGHVNTMGIEVSTACVLCTDDLEETHTHLFFECSYSALVLVEIVKLIWH